jgi:succinate dehydrogenase / fumarate reductase cytochrome b subunit
MAETSEGARPRPLSPHVLAWRWHVTMAASIANRISSGASFVGMFLLAGWALALASGQEAYETYMSLLGSIPGKVVLFGFTVAVMYHLAGGVRHLVWDLGKGYSTEIANLSAWACFIFAIVGSIALWVVAGLIGAL